MRSRLYSEDCLRNGSRKFGSATIYYPAVLIRFDGEAEPMLFTAREIDAALDRAAKNPEDIEQARENIRAEWRTYRRAAMLVVAGLLGCALLFLTGCKTDPIPSKPEPPQVVCASQCRERCNTEVPAWAPPDAARADAFDFIRPQVVDPMAGELLRCEERRKACVACMDAAEKAGAIRQ